MCRTEASDPRCYVVFQSSRKCEQNVTPILTYCVIVLSKAKKTMEADRVKSRESLGHDANKDISSSNTYVLAEEPEGTVDTDRMPLPLHSLQENCFASRQR